MAWRTIGPMRHRGLRAFVLVASALAGCGASELDVPGDSGTDGHAVVDSSAVPQGDALAEAPADALVDAPANVDARDARGDAAAFCPTPLTLDAGVATLSDVPIAQWCASNGGRIVEWTCGGFTDIYISVGRDCDREYLFAAASGQLVAVLGGCSGGRFCVMGDPSFQQPTDCSYANVSPSITDLCAEAGVPDAAPDGGPG